MIVFFSLLSLSLFSFSTCLSLSVVSLSCLFSHIFCNKHLSLSFSLSVCVYFHSSLSFCSLSLPHFCLLHTLISLSLSLDVFLSVYLFQLAMLFFLYIYLFLCVCVSAFLCVSCFSLPSKLSIFFSPPNLTVYCLNGLNGASKS
jgi:hypothetical protein